MSDSLPHWDMSVVFPGLDSTEFNHAFETTCLKINHLTALFNQLGIQKCAPQPLSQDQVKAFEQVVRELNEVVDYATTLRAYIYSFVSTESTNDLAQARLSEFYQAGVELSKLTTRFTAWIGSLDVDQLLATSAEAREYTFAIRQAKIAASHQMSPVEEELAADMNLSGAIAWSRMYNNLTSQIMVPVRDTSGKIIEMPMSVVRNLAYDSDANLRRWAYEAEIDAWKKHALPLAASLNSIKGEVITLVHHRGWESPLEQALFDNAIDRQTLDALMQAMRESFPDFRRYLKAKAHLLGKETLPWCDLFAPVSSSQRKWDYENAKALIVEEFGKYSEKMGKFAARAFEENWIDAEPRSGKQDGAFCMYLRKDESRVLTNFRPNYKSVSTLAHELGHAYHNLCLSTQEPLNRDTPMILAETASIFCETIIRRAILPRLTAEEQMEVLEAALMNACQVVVDISSRFLFEARVFEQRKKRELSVAELCSLMEQSQKETYGDGLDIKELHPYMWAAKPHYYSGERSFYNFPYAFGLLFGLGLYAVYLQSPDTFKQGYDELLSSTGKANAAELAAKMGIDIHKVEFWRGSLDTVRQDVERFEQLIAGK
ncbi:MAG TPA: M3 family oligoendopeptidase [Anaerolineaceae bacterium]